MKNWWCVEDEGRLKATENEEAFAYYRPSTQLEIATLDNRPSRLTQPVYPELIQKSGHQGATYIEHSAFVDQIEGRQSPAASAEEGFWSIVVASTAQESIAQLKKIIVDDFLEEQGIRQNI